jgi:hypothetical protein
VAVALEEHELYVGKCSDMKAMLALGEMLQEAAEVCHSLLSTSC